MNLNINYVNKSSFLYDTGLLSTYKRKSLYTQTMNFYQQQ